MNIYVLTSVNQNYSKYIERFAKSLIRTGADIVPVFAIEPNSKELKSQIESAFKGTNLSPRIFYSKFIPSRFDILKKLVSTLEEEDNYRDFITFIDIDDEVNPTYFNWIRNESLRKKNMVIANVVKHYEDGDSKYPYVSASYLSFNPNDSYLSWGSLIWGKFYSLDLVRIFLSKSKKLSKAQRIYDYEHYCVYMLSMLAKSSSEGVGFSKCSTYIWNRHSESLMTMSIDTVSKIVQSVHTLLPNNPECCIEATYVSLLTSLTSIIRSTDNDYQNAMEALEKFKADNVDIINATFNHLIYKVTALKLHMNSDGTENYGRFLIYQFLTKGTLNNVRSLKYISLSCDEVAMLNTGEFRTLHVLLRFDNKFRNLGVFETIHDTDRRYIDSGKVKFHFISNLRPVDLASKLSKYARNMEEMELITKLIHKSPIYGDLLNTFENEMKPDDWVICVSANDYVLINNKVEKFARQECCVVREVEV